MLYSKTTGGFYDREIHGDNIPADAVEITKDLHAALLAEQASGKRIEADANGCPVAVAQPAPSADQIIAAYTGEVQARLDAFAKTRGYDGILSACTYATSAVPKFKAEGQYCVDARDATWAKCYEIMAAVQSGARAMPVTFAEIEAELPTLAWPTL